MKKILIAATFVGAAGAGVILYLRNRLSASANEGNARHTAADAYKKLNDHMDTASRPAQHAMG